MYRVVAGDTFELIARKVYGTEKEAALIASANPGVLEPLTAGITLATPTQPDAPQDAPQQAAATGADEVALLVDGRRFRFWDSVNITRAIDSMDTVGFSAPMDPSFKGILTPFSFKNVDVTVGGSPLFTGTMVGVTPSIEADRKTVAVSGYALPGVLNDCTPPASSFPLEFNDLTLHDIAAAMVAPFGISTSFEAPPGAVFNRVAGNPSQTVLAFLTDLANQRGLIMGSSERGELVFKTSNDTGTPVARLNQGTSPLLSVSPSFNPQKYYSDITGIEPAVVGLAGSQFTAKNELLAGVVRPTSFEVADTLDADVKAAVEAKLGRMFANVATYAVSVSTWRDEAGNLWKPGTFITLTAPDAMVYTEYTFLIKSVTFAADRASRTATLSLVMPGAYSGKIPGSLPWD